MLRKIAGGIAVVLALVGLGVVQANYYDQFSQPQPVESVGSAQILGTITTGCVIRFDTNGPWIHDNEAHACTALDPDDPDAVTVEADGDILMVHSEFRGAIVSMNAEEDESIVARRIHCGPSGGLTNTVVRCYRTDTGSFVRGDSDQLACEFCNLWMEWEHEGTGL